MLASTSNAEGPKAMCGGALQVEMTINRKTKFLKKLKTPWPEKIDTQKGNEFRNGSST